MQKMKWYHGLIVFFIFIVMSQAIGLVFLLAYSFYNPEFNPFSLMAMFSKPGIILSSIAMFISFLSMPILYLKLLSKPIKASFNFKQPSRSDVIITALGVLATSTIVQYLVDQLVDIYPSFQYGFLLKLDFHKLIAEAIQTDNFLIMLVFALIIGVLPGIGEEFLFRGFIQKIYSNQFNLFWAIFLSGGLFGMLHLPQQISQGIAAFLIAFYLGYIFHKSGNLWIPMIAHAVNNSFFVILLFFFPEAQSVMTGETSGLWTLLSIPVAIYSVKYWMKKT